ncbi:MAG: tripartite tricarboxylate transporter substrate binding protein [Bacillota bacterium]
MVRRKVTWVFLVAALGMCLVGTMVAGCAGAQQAQQPAQQQQQKPAEPPKPKYPERPINMIVGFPAGGPTDLLARGMADAMQKRLGQPVTVTNMAGASGSVGANHVLGQAADGYTLFFGSEALSVLKVMDVADINWDSFEVIGLAARATPALVVPANSKYNTVQDLVKATQANPEKIVMSTAGPGTVPHVCGSMLQKHAGAKFKFVPMQGGAGAISAVLGGQADCTIEMIQSLADHVKAGRLKMLAVFTNETFPGFEKVTPIGTVYQAMKPMLPYGPYFGVFARKGTPSEVVQILKTTVKEIVTSADWKAYCEKLYCEALPLFEQDATKYLGDWTSQTVWLMWETGVAKKSPEQFGIPKPQAK